MNRFRLLFLVSTILLLVGCGGKTAVVNPQFVFENSDAGKSGIAHLSSLSDALQNTLLAAEKTRQGSRKNTQDALRQKIVEAQQRFTAEEQQVMTAVSTLLDTALETCRARGRYAVVISTAAVIASDPKADITQQVIDEMNKTALTFTPFAPQEERAGQ